MASQHVVASTYRSILRELRKSVSSFYLNLVSALMGLQAPSKRNVVNPLSSNFRSILEGYQQSGNERVLEDVRNAVALMQASRQHQVRLCIVKDFSIFMVLPVPLGQIQPFDRPDGGREDSRHRSASWPRHACDPPARVDVVRHPGFPRYYSNLTNKAKQIKIF